MLVSVKTWAEALEVQKQGFELRSMTYWAGYPDTVCCPAGCYAKLRKGNENLLLFVGVVPITNMKRVVDFF